MSNSSSPAIALPLLCAHDVRPARSASPEQPDRTGESPLHALRVTVAPYRSDGPAQTGEDPVQPLTPVPRSAAWVASSSTLSFQRSPEWPLTQRQLTAASDARASSRSGSHRSRLATGLFCEFFQP